jgi:hypothetical protein
VVLQAGHDPQEPASVWPPLALELDPVLEPVLELGLSSSGQQTQVPRVQHRLVPGRWVQECQQH